MKAKKYIQFGTVLITLLLPCLILFFVLLAESGFRDIPYLLLSVIFLLGLLCFYNLTITIDNTYVSFKMGVGFIKKQYKITDIKSCRPVRNSILKGIGIRYFPNVILYNVSGLKAVELEFHNSERVVRIGTNQPEEVAQQINSLIGGEEITTRLSESTQEKRTRELRFALVLIFALVIYGIIMNFRDNRAEISDESLVIRGMYGLTIPLSEIKQIDTVSYLPRMRRVNGFGIPGTIKGHVRLSDGTRATVFLKTKFSPVIVIQQQSSDRLIYLNFRNRERTISLYNQLKVQPHSSVGRYMINRKIYLTANAAHTRYLSQMCRPTGDVRAIRPHAGYACKP